MAVNYRFRRNTPPLSRLNAQPRSRVTIWKPLGEPTPVIPPILFALGAGNTLAVDDVTGEIPPWFTNDDFTLVTGDGNIEFVWNGTGWDAEGTFFDDAGSGYIMQGSDTTPARWTGAEADVGNAILQGDGSFWQGSNNLVILWSGV